jgi:small subunit ribosomal protein S18
MMFKPMKRKVVGGKGPGKGTTRGPGKKEGVGLLKKKVFRKRPCKFCLDKVTTIDYLDYHKFQKHLTERGKIMPSRISGSCASHQRLLARAVKKARVIGLLPFVAE